MVLEISGAPMWLFTFYVFPLWPLSWRIFEISVMLDTEMARVDRDDRQNIRATYILHGKDFIPPSAKTWNSCGCSEAVGQLFLLFWCSNLGWINFVRWSRCTHENKAEIAPSRSNWPRLFIWERTISLTIRPFFLFLLFCSNLAFVWVCQRWVVCYN